MKKKNVFPLLILIISLVVSIGVSLILEFAFKFNFYSGSGALSIGSLASYCVAKAFVSIMLIVVGINIMRERRHRGVLIMDLIFVSIIQLVPLFVRGIEQINKFNDFPWLWGIGALVSLISLSLYLIFYILYGKQSERMVQFQQKSQVETSKPADIKDALDENNTFVGPKD